MTEFNLKTPDIHGYRPLQDLIGITLTHSGNGQRYRIDGFAWLGVTDEWGFAHFCTEYKDAVVVVRPLKDLLGQRKGSTMPRYVMLPKYREIIDLMFSQGTREQEAKKHEIAQQHGFASEARPYNDRSPLDG